jgi:serine/threonine protein kinase
MGSNGLQRSLEWYDKPHRGRHAWSQVAIKTIWPKLFVEVGGDNTRALSAEHVASFCREAQLISSLQHPHVVSVLGVVQGQRSPAVVTEYMERSLRHVLDRQPRALNARKRLGLALDAARGMAYLHSRRIVHCDLKSSNLLVRRPSPRHALKRCGCDGFAPLCTLLVLVR